MISINRTSRPRLQVPGFSPEQMRDIADFSRAAEVDRISQGLNVNDEPAKPLQSGYSLQKRKAGARPVRDLRLTGAMLESRRVIESGENTATVAFDDEAQAAKAARNEAIEPMLGISPASAPAINEYVRREFAESVKRAQ
jgi:hypothetical protein